MRSAPSSSASSPMRAGFTPATRTTRLATGSHPSGTRRRPIVELGAALELDEADVRGAGAVIAEACALPLASARYVLFREVVGHPRLLELPPLLAIELQLGLLLGLDVLDDASVWTRSSGTLDCILTLGGGGGPSRRVRAEAKATLRQRSRLSLLGGSQLRSDDGHAFR